MKPADRQTQHSCKYIISRPMAYFDGYETSAGSSVVIGILNSLDNRCIPTQNFC